MGVFLIAEHRDAPEVVRYFLRADAQPATVGRIDGNTLRINSLMLSRRHCQFVLHKNGLVAVSDLSSTSGTWVNGQLVRAEQTISESDVVTIGDWQVRWERPFDLTSITNPEERAFLESIAKNPADESMRAVYADWLEEQGDRPLEVELLRIDREYATTRRPDLIHRRWTLSAQIQNPVWKCVVLRTRIAGCTNPAPNCVRHWEKASPKDHLQIRGCNACNADIFFASDRTEAQSWLETDQRVALDEKA
jgi:uncharacterized protein (TIGR02996 family)